MTEGVFFQDLAVVMSIAGLAAMAFSRFGWPKVFGYLAVGILMNGYTWGGAFLTDVQTVRTISQLGVVFLMLTMGLEFSTSDMKKIKNVSVPTAVIDTVVMTWIGYMVGTRVFGWTLVPSLFLGVAICDSATTLLSKMIGELGWSRRSFVKYTLGTSVCEDMVCVGLIALVTGVASGRGMSLGAVGLSMGGLLLFFLGTLLFGLILIPRLFASVAKRKDDEALLLTMLGLCFFISYVAYKLDFSLALGAFLVGILGASSEVKNRLHLLVAPLRSMFSAMFFVSIGLLVDPGACWANIGAIVLVSVVVVLGKGLNCFLGGILTGQSIRESVQMGLSLAQIGEFAFMVAIICAGLTDGETCPMFEIAIGASLITTFLNPFLIRCSETVGNWAQGACPRRFVRWIDTYHAFLRKYQAVDERNDSRRKVRRIVFELIALAILEGVVAAAFGYLTTVDWTRFSVFLERHEAYIFLLLTNVFIAALFVPVTVLATQLGQTLGSVVVGPGEAKWQAPVRHIVMLFAYVAVYGAFGAVGVMINTLAMPESKEVEWSIFVVMVVVGVVGWRFFRRAALRARARFEEALATDERLANLGEMITIQIPENMLNRIVIGPDSPAVGGTVVSLDIRAKTGASVVSLLRGSTTIRNVGPGLTFKAGDVLVAVGEADQIAALRELLGVEA